MPSLLKCLKFVLLAVLCAPWALLAVPAGAQSLVEPGLYQPADRSSTLSLSPQPDGSLEMMLWQGSELSGPGAGFAFAGRLVVQPQRGLLIGSWQSLPGSCCPGRGRGELKVLSPTSLRFTSFAPWLDRPSWPVLGQMVFSKIAPPQAVDPLAGLTGGWRLSLWYTDLLPGGQPADGVRGELTINLQGGGLAAQWQDRPGQTSLAARAQGQGAELIYRDPKAGYELSAHLRPKAGGLMLAGPFTSTLGRGEMRLVRLGLPASPTPAAGGQEGAISGLWVDPRTGNDFFKISGSEQGFAFTSYGGSLDKPRYLSKGRATPQGADRFVAQAKDVAGKCCGNQGRLIFRLLPGGDIEVSSFWWPQGRMDPGNPPADPYVIQRAQAQPAQSRPASQQAGRWPLVEPARAGLMSTAAGSVSASFTWRPSGQPAPATIFSQGGYRRDFDLYVDEHGYLGAGIFADGALHTLKSARAIKAGEPHQAWLIYQAPGDARLILDGKTVAQMQLPGPWAGSGSPYLVGASRWPGRTFSGQIEKVELFSRAVDPSLAGQPQLSLTPSQTPTGQDAPDATQAGPVRVRELIRLWNPTLLLHAYAPRPAEERALRGRGFVRKGPVAGLYTAPVEGAVGLWGFVHRGKSYTLLRAGQESPPAPPGTDALGLLGYLMEQPAQGAVPLLELKAQLPDQLRGGKAVDVLYTTLPASAQAAQAAGYSQPVTIGYVRPVAEAAYTGPALYTWQGVWRGDGWGRFIARRQGDDLVMFWYYANLDGPRYLGRYRIAPDGRSAQGIAVGRPGPKATYYRQNLRFLAEGQGGPRLQLTAWRIAAPLDDGRLVKFKNPKAVQTLLQKQSQTARPAEDQAFNRGLAGPGAHPAKALQNALQAAKAHGRLEER